MDKFREKQNRIVPVGGLHCTCCNRYVGKRRHKLNRLTRRKLKIETEKETETE